MVLLAPGLGFGRDIRKLIIHGPSIAAPSRRDDLALLGAATRTRASAYNRGNQAISVSLGRSVVLTIGRLVASNSTCFASVQHPLIAANQAAARA